MIEKVRRVCKCGAKAWTTCLLTALAVISQAVSKCFVGVGAASNREELFAQPLCCTTFVSEAGPGGFSKRRAATAVETTFKVQSVSFFL